MKRPIDPNLSTNTENDFLPGLDGGEKADFGFNDYRTAPKDIEFKVVESTLAKPDSSGEATADITELTSTGKAVEELRSAASDGSSLHHHSPSSDSSHHHHSSSSDSSHHHSSSSDSSHHHHSSSSGSSHHHHRHHHSSSKKDKKKKLPLAARIAIALIILLLLGAVIVVGTFFVLKSRGERDLKPNLTANTNYQETIEYNGHTYKYNEDIVSFAFMGVDQRELHSSDEAEYVGAADTDIVAAVDTKTGKTKVIAIPRDTMVDIDITTERGVFVRTDKAQLCLAYAYGDGQEDSAQKTMSAMSRILMGVPIEKYFVLDLNGIKPLNDAIGGVTVTSLYTFKDYGIKEGETVTLKGDMAEIYVRIRDLDAIDASLNRTERQVQYVKAYAAQVLPAVLKDFGVIRNLYNTASNYSHTNLSLSNVTYMGSMLLSKGVSDFESVRIEGEMKEGHSDNMPEVTHAEFYPDQDSLTQAVLEVFYTQID